MRWKFSLECFLWLLCSHTGWGENIELDVKHERNFFLKVLFIWWCCEKFCVNFEMKIVDETLKALNLMFIVLNWMFLSNAYMLFKVFQCFYVLKVFKSFYHRFKQCFQNYFEWFSHLFNVIYLLYSIYLKNFPKYSHLSQCPRKSIIRQFTLTSISSLSKSFSLSKFICSEQFFEFYIFWLTFTNVRQFILIFF